MIHKEVLREVVDKLHAAYPEASIGIGGSVANETYRADSDIDILLMKEGQVESFSITCMYRGIRISIFSFSISFILKNERRYLYSFHEMPITFISGASIIYDDKGLIQKLKETVRDIMERRFYLKDVLIDKLKNEITRLCMLDSQSSLLRKQIHYTIADGMLSIFFLSKMPRLITKKQIKFNWYDCMIVQDEYLCRCLKKYMLYSDCSAEALKGLFKNYVLTNY